MFLPIFFFKIPPEKYAHEEFVLLTSFPLLSILGHLFPVRIMCARATEYCR